MTPDEIPMVPITMVRNALGVAEGGVGGAAGSTGLPAQRGVLAGAHQLAALREFWMAATRTRRQL